MATRINTKFVIILSSVLVVLTAGVVFAVMKFNRSAEDFVRLGDKAIREAETAREAGEIEKSNELYKKAAEKYGAAFDKEPGTKDSPGYMYAWIDAQNKITVQDMAKAYEQLDNETDGANTIYNARQASDEDRQYLYQLLHERLRMNLVINNTHPIGQIRNYANNRLSNHPDDATALKYSAIVESYLSRNENDDDQRALVMGRLNKALEGEPDNAWLYAALGEFYYGNAIRLYFANGQQTNPTIQGKVAKSYDAISKAIALGAKANPAAQVWATQLMLNLRLYDPERVAEINLTKIKSAMTLAKTLSDKANRDQLVTEELATAANLLGTIGKGNSEQPFDGRAAAIKLAQAVVQDRPDEPAAHVILATQHRTANDLKAAESANAKGLSVERVTNGRDYFRDQRAREELMASIAEVKLDLASRSTDLDKRKQMLADVEERIERLAAISSTQTEKRDTRVHMLRGYLEFARGRANEAVTHFVQANVAQQGSNARTLIMLAKCYQRMNQPGKVIEHYEQIVAQNASSPYRLDLIRSYLSDLSDTQNIARAQGHLDTYQKIYPESVDGIQLRAQILNIQDKTDEAIALLQKQDLKANPQLENLLAGLLRKSGDSTKALEILRARLTDLPEGERMNLAIIQQLIQSLPDNDARLAEIARLQKEGLDTKVAGVLIDYIKTGQRKLESELVLLEHNNYSPAVLALMKYRLYQQWSKPDLARKQLDEANRLDPTLPSVIELRFNIALNESRWDDAEQAIEEMLAINDKKLPDIAVSDGVFMRAMLIAMKASKMDAGEDQRAAFAQAEDAFSEALDQYSDFVRGWIQLGRIQIALGDNLSARESLQEALSRRSNNIEALELMAQAEAATQDQVLALNRLEQIVRLRLNHPTALNRHTALAQQIGARKTAIALREYVRGVAPGNTDNRRALSQLYAGEERHADAKREIDEAIKADGKTRENMQVLARILVQADQHDKAIQDVKAYLAELGDKVQWQDRVLLARVYELAENPKEADRAFDLALEIEGEPEKGKLSAVKSLWAQTLLERGETKRAADMLDELNRQQPDNDVLKRSTVQAFLRAGALDKAEAMAKQMKASPGRYQLLIQVAAAREGGLLKAVQLSRDAVKAYPDNLQLRLGLARYLSAQQGQRAEEKRDYNEAYRMVQAIVKDEPKSNDAKLLLADLLLAMDRTQEAESMLLELLNAAPNNMPSNQRLYGIKLSEARRLLRANKRDESQTRATEALNIINQMLEQRPDMLTLYRAGGEAANLAGLQERSTQLFAKAFEMSKTPRDLQAYASALMIAGEPAAARDLLGDADNASLVVDNLGIQALRGRALAASGQTEIAANLYRSLLKSNTELNTRAQLVSEVLVAFKGDPVRPIQVVESALGKDLPYQIDLLLSTYQLGAKQYPDVIKRLSKYDAQPIPDEVAQYRALLQLALSRQETGAHQSAKATYEKALAIAEKNKERITGLDRIQLFNNMAYLLADVISGYEKDAVKYAQQAVDLLPETVAPQTAALLEDTLGWAQYRAGQSDEAIKTLLGSIEKADLAPNRMHLGAVYLAKGDKDKAREHLTQALAKAKAANDTKMIKRTEKYLSELD